MRDRLIVAFVALTLAVVTVLLVERAYTTSAMIHAHEQRKIERSATVIAALLAGTSAEATSTELLEGVLFADEHLRYVDAAGAQVEAGPDAVGGHDAEDLSATAQVPGGGTVTVDQHAEVVDQRVADAVLTLVLVVLGLLLVAVLLAVWLGNRLSRPFASLAVAADRIGKGDLGVEVPRSPVPEADAVARALRATAEDLAGLVRRERDFAAHASHELRSPLTATRLELEEVALSPQTPPEVVSRVTAALGQLDRLSSAVARMLDASRASRLGAQVDIDLTALVRDTVSRWRDLAPARPITASSAPVVAVRMPAGALMHALDSLIGNAVTHGRGCIEVGVCEGPAYVELRVSDEGARQRAAEGMRIAANGSGGLAATREIAESLGGRLALADDVRTTFSLVLPRSAHETVAS